MYRKLIYLVCAVVVLSLIQASVAKGDPNLIGWWKFDEGDGNIAHDVAGEPNDGTFSYAGVTWLTPGLFGASAIHVDGSPGSRVSIGNWNPASGTGELTVAIWARWAGPQGYSQGLISKRDSWSSTGLMFMFEITGYVDGMLALRQFSDASTDVASAPGTMMEYIGKWAHLAATFDGNEARLYIDGNEVASGTFFFGDGTDAGMTIGNTNSSLWESCPEAFNGDLDEARIYNRALTQAEIAQLTAFLKAKMPSPTDGALGVEITPILTWLPGAYAADVNGHRVYLDPNEQNVIDRSGCDVNSVSTTDPCYPLPIPPAPLELSQTYYWAVDEVNDACEPYLWEGDVWRFTIESGIAKNSSPANRAKNVDPNIVLSWSPGPYAVSHNVYFGTDYNDVNDALPLAGDADGSGQVNLTDVLVLAEQWLRGPPENSKLSADLNDDGNVNLVDFAIIAGNWQATGDGIFKGHHVLDANSYDPCGLELGTTYYWRIDEVNDSGMAEWQGDVWSFTTNWEWTYDGGILVGAYYYPWYGPGAGGHGFHDTLRDHLVPKQGPALGYYNNRDPNVIAAHINQSHRANIHFWAVSWWGPGTFEDNVFKNTILTNEYAGKLKYAIMYESVGRLGANYSNLLPDFQYFADNYFNNLNYLKIDGKPVIFIYLTRVYFRDTEGYQALANLRAAFPNLYIVADDIFGTGYSSAYANKWDAVTAYDVYGQTLQPYGSTPAALNRLENILSDAKTAANRVNVGLVPFAMPGFNDKAVREGHDAAPRYFDVLLGQEDDAQSVEGNLFRAMLRDVVVPYVDPLAENMLMITSFNEWHEDTQIEPTAGTAGTTNQDDSGSGTYYTQGYYYTDYGNLYLDILRQATCFLEGDLNQDCCVDLSDFAMLALYWMESNCGVCGGADLDDDADVDFNDLKKLTDNWLKEQFWPVE